MGETNGVFCVIACIKKRRETFSVRDQLGAQSASFSDSNPNSNAIFAVCMVFSLAQGIMTERAPQNTENMV